MSLKQFYSLSMSPLVRQIIQADAILVLKWSACVYLHRVCMNRINTVQGARLVCQKNSIHLSESKISVNIKKC